MNLDDLMNAAQQCAANRQLIDGLDSADEEELCGQDLEEAKRLEDLIEETLEKEYKVGQSVEVPLGRYIAPKIIRWLRRRYSSWHAAYIKGKMIMRLNDG